MKQFEHKVAIVTGASSGIGKACALQYAKEGAKIVVADLTDKGNEVAEIIRKNGGEAFFIKTDVSVAADCELMVKKTLEKYGGLDIAVNNAGIGGESNLLADYTVEGWNKVIAVNLSGVFYCMKYQLTPMLGQKNGSIINMSSILGQVGFAGAPAYVAAKHGLLGLTQNAALEYAGKGIRVNCVGPAFIKTPLLESLDSATLDFLVTQHPIGRLGTPEEVAELVIWLSSEKASFITGSYYPVDGGYLSR